MCLATTGNVSIVFVGVSSGYACGFVLFRLLVFGWGVLWWVDVVYAGGFADIVLCEGDFGCGYVS